MQSNDAQAIEHATIVGGRVVPLLRVGGSLAVGLAANVLICWSSALIWGAVPPLWFWPLHDTTPTAPTSLLYASRSGLTWTSVLTSRVGVAETGRSRQLAPLPAGDIPPGDIGPDTNLAEVMAGSCFSVRTQYGWPVRSLESHLRGTRPPDLDPISITIPSVENVAGVAAYRPNESWLRLPVLLPTRPLWFGTLTNTLVWSSVSFGVASLWAIRQRPPRRR